MKIIEKTGFNSEEKKQLFRLWNTEYPKSLNYSTLSEFELYLLELNDVSHVLILNKQEKIKGWFFGFIRENERWFGMILDQTIQGKGWGTKLLTIAQKKHAELNGWVIDGKKELKKDGASYSSPLAFYQKNGFNILVSRRLELPNISAVKIQWTNKLSSG